MTSYYHYHAGVISRSGDKSVSASSAYISGEKLVEERTGMVFSYPRPEGDVLKQKILLPEGVNPLYGNLQTFVNTLEKNEDRIIGMRYKGHSDPIKHAKSMKRRDALLATASTGYECTIALPQDLNTSQKIELTEALGEALFVKNRLMVLYAIHDEKKNPHVHMIASMRAIDQEGNFSLTKHRYSRDVLKEMRETVAHTINEKCQGWGYNVHVDHRSLADQGIERRATLHRGWYASKLQGQSRIMAENQEIESENEQIIVKKPEELIKSVMQSKVLFTQEGFKGALVRYVKRPENREVLVSSLLKQHEEGALDKILVQNLKQVSCLKKEDRFVLTEAMKERLSSCLLSLAETVSVGSKHQMLESDYTQEKSLLKSLKALSESSMHKRSLWQRAKNVVVEAGYKIALSAGAPSFMRSYVEETYGDVRGAPIDRSLLGGREANRFVAEFEATHPFKLTSEQVAAVDHLSSPTRLSVLLGRAGTGKSTVLSLVRQIYETQGYEVKGAAFQGRVAEALNREQGISSTTLHKLVYEWNEIKKLTHAGDRISLKRAEIKQRQYGFNEKTVLVLDEVSMAPTFLLTRILSELVDKGGKAILVGDPDQLKEIGRGNVGRLVFDRSESVYELKEVVRQKRGNDRLATQNLSLGDVQGALEHYKDRIHYYGPQGCEGLEVVKDTVSPAHESKLSHEDEPISTPKQESENISLTSYLGVIQSFLTDLEKGRESLMIAGRQQDVDALNEQARFYLKEEGKLGEGFKLRGQDFYVGDRILLRQNDFTNRFSQITSGQGVICNGAMGHVMGHINQYLLLKLDSGATAKIDMEKYGRVELGYAITGNMAQGLSVDHVHVYLSSRGKIASDLMYVMMSRHKDNLTLHMPRSFASTLHELTDRIRAPQDVLQAADIEELEWAHPKLLKAMESYGEGEQRIQALQTERSLDPDVKKEQLRPLYGQRKALAKEIVEQWQEARIYMHDQGVSLDQIKVHATGQYPLDLGVQFLIKEFELTHPFEEKAKREALALQLSGMMAVNKKIKAGIYGGSFETACQTQKEAEMITYRGLLKGYAEVESQIESLRDSRKAAVPLGEALKATGEQNRLIKLYQERDKVAAALLDRHYGLRKDTSHLGKISYERLQDQAERHTLRESLQRFKEHKTHSQILFDKEAAGIKLEAAAKAYALLQDKCDLETGKLSASHYAILKESGVRERELQAFASVSLEKLQKAFYTLRPEGTQKKELFLKRVAALNELTSYQRLEAQKTSLERSQKLSIEQKQNKVREVSFKQERVAFTLVTDHKRLSETQYLLMGFEKESIQNQALKHQVRELIQSYEQDKTAVALSKIKDLVLDEHQEVKKPVRALLYEKGLYAEIFPREKRVEREQIHPRDIIERVNERVDILKLAKDLIPEEVTSARAHEIRFRKNQSLVVSSKGWKDFMTDEGGRAYSLAQTFGQGSSYKDILQTLAPYTDPQTRVLIDSSFRPADLGANKVIRVTLQEQERFKKEARALRASHEKADAAHKAEKIRYVQALYEKSSPIQESVAESYLKGRGISSKILEQAPDLRFSDQIYNSETKQGDHRALLAFARNRAGEITGVQLTYLQIDGTKDTSLENPKKSMGVIKGSAVSLTPYCSDKPLLVAEGVETALSLVEAGAQGHVVAALGINNVKTIAEEAAVQKAEHNRLLTEQGIDPKTPFISANQIEQQLRSLSEQEIDQYDHQKEQAFGKDWAERVVDLEKQKGAEANLYYDLMASDKHLTPEKIVVILDNDRDPNDPTNLPRHEEKLRSELGNMSQAQDVKIETLQPQTPGTDYNDLLREKEGLKQIKMDLEKSKVEGQKNRELARDR